MNFFDSTFILASCRLVLHQGMIVGVLFQRQKNPSFFKCKISKALRVIGWEKNTDSPLNEIIVVGRKTNHKNFEGMPLSLLERSKYELANQINYTI